MEYYGFHEDLPKKHNLETMLISKQVMYWLVQYTSAINLKTAYAVLESGLQNSETFNIFIQLRQVYGSRIFTQQR